MTSTIFQRSAIIASVSAFALGAATVNAQTAEDSVSFGEDIVVTAQKREQRLQDVPISIQVMGGQAMQESGIRTFEDLGPMVPNLTIVKSPAANVISMRGVASSAGSPSLEQSVAIFVDGIYGGASRQFAAPFLDIERMEVLRGPQGALVGKNTNAGAINITTVKPGDEFGGYLRADYGLEQKGPTIEGAVDVPLAEGLAVRFTGKYSDVDGYLRNTHSNRLQPERREVSGRVTLRYDSYPVTITAKYEHADVRVDGSPVQVLSDSRGRGFDYVKESGLDFSDEFDNIYTNIGVVQADMQLGGDYTLTTITGFSQFKNRNRIDADFTEMLGASADFDQSFRQLSQEIRLLSPTGNFIDFVVGAYYHIIDLKEERTTGVLFAPPASTYRVFDQQTESLSFYGSATVNFTEELRAIGSVRYTHETKNARYRRYAGPQTYTDLRTGVLVADFSDRLGEGIVDPSITLQYDVTPDLMVYGSFGMGSKGGGFQGAISNAEPFSFRFDHERSKSFEAGVKASFLGVGHVNLSAFHTRYEDLQVSVALPTPDGLSAPFFTGNAGDAIVTGVELDGMVRLGGGFQLAGNAAWMPRARYLDYPSGPCYTGQTPNGAQPGSCDMSRQRLNFTPTWSGAMTASVDREISNALRGKASVTGIFSTSSRRDGTADPLNRQGGYVKLDGRLAIADIDDRWELALVGRNLTNKTTMAFLGVGGLASTVFAPDARTLTLDPPRQILVQASVRF